MLKLVDFLPHLFYLFELFTLVEVLGCLSFIYFFTNFAFNLAKDAHLFLCLLLFIIWLHNKGTALPFGDLLLHGRNLLRCHVLLFLFPFTGHLCSFSSLAHSIARLSTWIGEGLMPNLHDNACVMRSLLVRLRELLLISLVYWAKLGFSLFSKWELRLFDFLLLFASSLLFSGIILCWCLFLRFSCFSRWSFVLTRIDLLLFYFSSFFSRFSSSLFIYV